MDDLEIIAKIRNGNADAYALLVEKYHRPLLTFIFRIVDDESMVEDIGQEVFFNVYKSLKDFDQSKGTPFSAWLFISARTWGPKTGRASTAATSASSRYGIWTARPARSIGPPAWKGRVGAGSA